MKRPFKSIFLGVLFFVFASMIKESKPNEIVYSAERSLTWNDFKAKPDSSSPHEAWTWSGISYSYSWTVSAKGTVFLDYVVYSYFDINQSWIKKGKQTDELLKHEQLHFDITEIHARYFRAALEDFEFTKNVEAEVDSLFQIVDQSRAEMHAQYDQDTEHSRNKTKQTRWESFVQAELDKYADYAMEFE